MAEVVNKFQRIAIVLPHLRLGGIEVAAAKLANELHGTQYPVCVVLGRREGELIGQLSPEIPLIVLKNSRAMRSVLELGRVLTSQQVDVVYSGTNARNISTLLATRLMTAARRPKVIISEHTQPRDYLAAARMPRLRRLLMRALYPLADLLAAPTEGLGMAWKAELGIRNPPVATLPNPILDERDLAVARSRPDRDPDLVLAIGRMHPAKGQDLLIRAFARARQARPGLRLDLLGDGDFRPELETLVTRAGVSSHVRFRGVVQPVAPELAKAGLLVVPSRREGFGNVVVEALAQGTPVVATDCPGPRALLAGAAAGGRIVPTGAIDEMAAAIAAMAGDPDALMAAREAGDGLIARYSVASATKAFVDRINELFGMRNA